jgi:hypothetical protein
MREIAAKMPEKEVAADAVSDTELDAALEHAAV